MESISPAEALTRVVALTQAPDESGLLLLGEHGIGKSHLLEQVHSAASINSVLMHVNRSERRFPLAGFRSLFAALSPEQALESHRRFTLRSEEPDALFSAAHDLLALIRDLELPPTVALIDDLDRMDSASRAVLGTIVSHLAGTSLWLVATATDPEPVESGWGFAAGRLTRLGTDDLVRLAAAGTRHLGSTLYLLADYSGGNPRILQEQVAVLHADQDQGQASLVLPPRPTDTVHLVSAASEGSLSAGARSVLELVALAPMSHLAAIRTLIRESDDDVEELIDAGVLQRRGQYVVFSDQRLRSRLYWDQGSRSRRERHRALSEACSLHDERLATWHQSWSAEGSEKVESLLDAAITLVQEGRVGAAVEFIERALSRAERIEDHARQLIVLCGLLLRDGHPYLADRYTARAHPTHPEQSMDLLNIKLIARFFHRQQVVDDELLALAHLHADANLDGACTMLCLGAAHRTERWEIDDARRLIDEGLLLADNAPKLTQLKMEAMRDIIDGLDGRSVEEDTVPDPDLDSMITDPDLLLLRARGLSVREDYQGARRLFTAVRNHPIGHTGLRADLATYGIIRNEKNAGEFRMARVAIDSWTAAAASLTRGTATFAYFKAWYAYSLGDFDEANEYIDTCLELASQEAAQALQARAHALRATIQLLEGDADSSVTTLRTVSAASTRFRNPSLLRHWADYTEVCVHTGRIKEAAATVAALERRLSVHRSRWGDLALLRCRALVESGEPSLHLFDAAVKQFGPGELPYELGRTLRCFANRQDELGMSAEAMRTRMTAAAAFRSAGADAWTKDSEAGARVAAPRSTRQEGVLEKLTAEQQTVAQHVVHGLRNREIAQEMFVSVRTVELRLTNIYRALNIDSRAQLAAALTGTAATADDPRNER
ncbi:helix-turn-helix transcriptional regulator [Aeromicrobium sp. 9AM]|uniref:helix-turn-helix transcriptional regulator n=1 Tax=Aeromicrobium sp. 9AM TaxID=2653126 RepID=UPI0012EFCDE3|nr:LuxR C-terminal-related transcriptional regulator [Aeromicrobium sp. 9AM]VXB12417.1 conserved hypothetical protein [Aeromicrobium sp. 9AM]